ncbi:COG4223 family protein [Microvirga alba]|uniref:Uncharacterized protein n=1 Tax=Microvirga alba TaxID=2791025 RepID=A0A931BSE0_9HYPH|nr:hypothetical protein [Microvirga alba]MBF9232930.1 hypothetical protein [Microvirga alba]
MTDSSDPKAPNSSRKKTTREPATIDLKATIIDDGARPDEKTAAEAERVADEAVSQPEETFDSGAGTDSIASGGPFQAAPPPAPPARDHQVPALIGAGLVGGLIGAGLVYGLQVWRGPAGLDDSRLVQLEQRVGVLSQTGNLQALDGRIKALETGRTVLDQRVQVAQTAAEKAAARAEEALNRPLAPIQAPQNEAALTDLSNRVSSLENQVNSENERVASATQGLDRRLADQGQAFAALSQKFAEGPQAAAQAGIRVVLAERLNDSVRAGTSYADVLATLKKVDGDAARLAPLEPFAERGAPTATALAQSFKPVSADILREDRAAAGSWTDRLMRMADRIVTIRPVDQPGSTSVPSLVARIEQALARGDVVDAAAAWDALPEPARRMSEKWGILVKNRAAAEKAASAVASDALAALNRTAQ